jgi:hypothetical protein
MPQQPRTWQFGLADMFVVLGVAAVLLGVDACMHGMLHRLLTPAGAFGYLAIALLLVACWLARVRADVNVVCGVLVIAWQVALIGMVYRIIGNFNIINAVAVGGPVLLAMYRAVLAEMVVPVVLSAVAVGFLFAESRGSPARATKWAMVATMLAIADLVLIALAIVCILGCRIQNGGVLDWSEGLY